MENNNSLVSKAHKRPAENIHVWMLDHLNITEEQKMEIVAAMEGDRGRRLKKKKMLEELLSLKEPEFKESEYTMIEVDSAEF